MSLQRLPYLYSRRLIVPAFCIAGETFYVWLELELQTFVHGYQGIRFCVWEDVKNALIGIIHNEI